MSKLVLAEPFVERGAMCGDEGHVDLSTAIFVIFVYFHTTQCSLRFPGQPIPM